MDQCLDCLQIVGMCWCSGICLLFHDFRSYAHFVPLPFCTAHVLMGYNTSRYALETIRSRAKDRTMLIESTLTSRA
jgi:hypothetical protein